MPQSIKAYTYPFQLKKTDVLRDGPSDTGGQPFELDSNTMLTWVDLSPEARFTHPTAYILISGSHVRVEKGGWWPVLNGQAILYGQNPVVIPSPFDISTDAPDPDTIMSLLGGDGPTPFGNAGMRDYLSTAGTRHVFAVNHIELAILKSMPPQLMISCLGITRTSGWKNARLKPRIYTQPPEDGIWEFDFVADPPTGIVLQKLTPVVASYLYAGAFSNWKGVRVLAETNAQEHLFGSTKEPTGSGHVLIDFGN